MPTATNSSTIRGFTRKIRGAWQLNEAQAKRLREYVERGGFIMLDDSFGDREWATMKEGVQMILPDRPIEDLPDGDAIFHLVFDLDDRIKCWERGTSGDGADSSHRTW